MDIRQQQAYYQQMRQQQVYHAYAAGIGSDPTPPPPPPTPSYDFNVTSQNIDDPGFCSTLNVTVDMDPISMNYNEPKQIQEGKNVTYNITIKPELSASFSISKIDGVDVEESEKYDYTSSFTMTGSKTVTITFGD